MKKLNNTKLENIKGGRTTVSSAPGCGTVGIMWVLTAGAAAGLFPAWSSFGQSCWNS